MKAFFKCLCLSKHRLLAKDLERKGVEVVVIGSDPIKRREAKQYNMKPPFIVNNGVAEKL